MCDKSLGVPVEKSIEPIRKEEHASQEDTQNPNLIPPPSPQVDPCPPPCKKTNNNRCHPLLWFNAHVEKWKPIYEFFGMVGVLLTALLIWRQYGEMVKSTKVSVGQLEAMKGQLDVMQKSTEVTIGQLHEMQLDQRAWVFFDISSYNITKESSNYVVHINVKNSGKTPATIEGSVLGDAIRIEGVPTSDSPVAGTNEIIMPNQSLFETYSINTNILNVCPFYVFGTVWYRDIFKEEHWAQFCYFIGQGVTNVQPMFIHSSCDDLNAESTQNGQQ
jgi:hypothetical protein